MNKLLFEKVSRVEVLRVDELLKEFTDLLLRGQLPRLKFIVLAERFKIDGAWLDIPDQLNESLKLLSVDKCELIGELG